jgi:hypothetical protein
MKCRRKIALLASSALVLQGLLAALPMPAAAHDDLATFFYWKIPLGGPDQDSAKPSFGFNMMEAENVWLTPSVKDTDVQFAPPPLVDLQFNGGDEITLPSLSLSGIDVGAMVDNALYAGPGEAPHTGEYILIGAGVGLGGLIVCAALECFGNSHDRTAAASSGPPASSGPATFTEFNDGDVAALGMVPSF